MCRSNGCVSSASRDDLKKYAVSRPVPLCVSLSQHQETTQKSVPCLILPVSMSLSLSYFVSVSVSASRGDLDKYTDYYSACLIIHLSVSLTIM